MVKAIRRFIKPTLLILNIAFSNSTVNLYHPQQRAVQLLFYTMDESIATQAPKGHHLQTLYLLSPKLCFLHISMSQVIPANLIAATTMLGVSRTISRIDDSQGELTEHSTYLYLRLLFTTGEDYKAKSARGKDTWDKAKRKPGRSLQTSSPSEFTQIILNSFSNKLKQHM